MRTIILPGYSKHNRDWAEDMAEKFLADGIEIFVHDWKHWSGEAFVITDEVGVIRKNIGNEKINIIAKSIGTLVLMNLLESFPGVEKQIEKVILCGIPLDIIHDETEDVFRKNLYKIASPHIVLFQNVNDPHGSLAGVSKFIKGINPDLKIVEKQRNDHEYPFAGEFEEFLRS